MPNAGHQAPPLNLRPFCQTYQALNQESNKYAKNGKSSPYPAVRPDSSPAKEEGIKTTWIQTQVTSRPVVYQADFSGAGLRYTRRTLLVNLEPGCFVMMSIFPL